MRGLFFKVFIIFWIAQSLIFVISTALIVRRHFEGPEAPVRYARQQFAERRQCCSGGMGKRRVRRAARPMATSIAQTVSLADATGQPLCKPAGMEGLDKNVTIPNRIYGRAGGSAVFVEGSGLIGKRETICVSLEPAACAAETEPFTGPVALCISAASSGDCGGGTDDVCAGAAIYASGDTA